MGLLRMLWRSTSIGRAVDTTKNILEEGRLVDGYKKTLKEDLCEDNPITASIYNIGKYDGKKDGYVEASNEYESKLLEQAEAFLSQKKSFQKEQDAYEQLLDEYEEEIERLNKIADKTQEEKDFLKKLIIHENALKSLGE